VSRRAFVGLFDSAIRRNAFGEIVGCSEAPVVVNRLISHLMQLCQFYGVG